MAIIVLAFIPVFALTGQEGKLFRPLAFTKTFSMAGAMMVITTLLVGMAEASLLRRLQASTVWIERASGVVLTAAGIYLGYYYIAAGM